MATAPFAISVHSFVNSVGADAGFASIIGLAILVLLYFAQARETATLRERLDETAQHAATLEARLAQLAQMRSAPPVAPAPPGAAGARPMGSAAASVRRPAAAATAGAVAAAGGADRTGLELPGPLLGAPAGMAAPPTGSLTRSIPTPAAMPALATAAASPPAPSLAPVGVAGPADDTILVPATVAAGANGHGGPPVVGATAVAPPPRVQIRPGGDGGPGASPRRPLPPLREPAFRRPGLARRIIPGLIGLGAAIVIIVVLIVITSSGTKTPAHHAASRTTAKRHKAKAAFNPATVNVAVLNGTAVNNLAHSVAIGLTNAGYKIPSAEVATAADQTHSTTIVGYTPGHQADAAHVARALKLSAGDIAPADAQALGVACTSGSAAGCPADVVVTVGMDLQSAATTTPATGSSGTSTG